MLMLMHNCNICTDQPTSHTQWCTADSWIFTSDADLAQVVIDIKGGLKKGLILADFITQVLDLITLAQKARYGTKG